MSDFLNAIPESSAQGATTEDGIKRPSLTPTITVDGSKVSLSWDMADIETDRTVDGATVLGHLKMTKGKRPSPFVTLGLPERGTQVTATVDKVQLSVAVAGMPCNAYIRRAATASS